MYNNTERTGLFLNLFVDPFEDQFAKKKGEKKERVAKNELQRLRNIARAQKSKGVLFAISYSHFLLKDLLGGYFSEDTWDHMQQFFDGNMFGSFMVLKLRKIPSKSQIQYLHCSNSNQNNNRYLC